MSRIGNIDDLPQELKEQLMICNQKDIEKKIIEVIKSYDNYANIDEVMVGLYRRFKIITKRTDIVSRLYRMAKKGLLLPIKNKKGAYKLNY
jgi:hypothetical protein